MRQQRVACTATCPDGSWGLPHRLVTLLCAPSVTLQANSTAPKQLVGVVSFGLDVDCG